MYTYVWNKVTIVSFELDFLILEFFLLILELFIDHISGGNLLGDRLCDDRLSVAGSSVAGFSVTGSWATDSSVTGSSITGSSVTGSSTSEIGVAISASGASDSGVEFRWKTKERSGLRFVLASVADRRHWNQPLALHPVLSPGHDRNYPDRTWHSLSIVEHWNLAMRSSGLHCRAHYCVPEFVAPLCQGENRHVLSHPEVHPSFFFAAFDSRFVFWSVIFLTWPSVSWSFAL